MMTKGFASDDNGLCIRSYEAHRIAFVCCVEWGGYLEGVVWLDIRCLGFAKNDATIERTYFFRQLPSLNFWGVTLNPGFRLINPLMEWEKGVKVSLASIYFWQNRMIYLCCHLSPKLPIAFTHTP